MNNVNDFIKNNYTHRNPGVRSKLKNMLKFGKLANTGKLVIFPV
ncbi:fructose-bisphosphate aldolase, partial [archaeon]|nr:fructose-bisphosphate aldolase [archaeon]